VSGIVGYLIGQHGELSGLRVAIPENGLVLGRDADIQREALQEDGTLPLWFRDVADYEFIVNQKLSLERLGR